MKKFFAAIVLFVLVAFSCAGCFDFGEGPEGSGKEPPIGGSETTDTDTGTGSDKGDSMDEGPKIVTNETYGSFWMRCHTYKTMPVGAYNALPPKTGSYTYSYLSSPETYAAYKEAGVNVMMGLYEQIDTNALDMCADNGLAYLLHLSGSDNIPGPTSPVLTSLLRARYHDAFAGVMQSDEPGFDSFEAIKRSQELLDGYMPEDVTGALWHVNLFPTYANQSQLYYRVSGKNLPEGVESYTYEQYLADYMRICQPKVLSYDFYPCNAKGTLTDGYFQNMALVRAAAMEANIPFWVYIQTCSFSKGTRIPSKADILWQVNTALTYGAKGIQYFTGVVAASNAQETFNGAMFDRDGNRTEVYEYVKAANKQIGAADEVLMCAKSKGVIVCGTSPWEDCGIPEADRIASYGKLASAEAGHSLVGCFDHDGKTALYITDNSVTEGDAVTLTFTSSVSGYTIVKGEKKAFSGETLSLAPEAGEGILVVIE